MRLQTRFRGRITSGLSKNELTKTVDIVNLNKGGEAYDFASGAINML
jgi:hypothetical protein